MGDDTNISVIIIYSFAFLFIVFFILQQGDYINQSPTGSAIFDTLDTSSIQNFFNADILQNLTELPLTTLIIIAVALIVIIFLIILIIRRIKKKKQQAMPEMQDIPKPDEKSLSDLNKEFNPPKSEKQTGEIDLDINKLFSESDTEKEQIKVIEKKSETDLNELKQFIRPLIKRNYTKESIVKYLNNKGYNLGQIRQAIDSINQENLNDYIKRALAQGFSKQEIMNALVQAGWNKEDVLKYMQ